MVVEKAKRKTPPIRITLSAFIYGNWANMRVLINAWGDPAEWRKLTAQNVRTLKRQEGVSYFKPTTERVMMVDLLRWWNSMLAYVLRKSL